MAQIQKLLHGKKIRSLYDVTKKTYWFSVVDVIAALRGTDYDTARKYWKQTKGRLAKKLKIFTFRQLKMVAKDGKLRFTDVMRYKDIVRLIQKLPCAAGSVFSKLIGETAAGSRVMRDVFEFCGQNLRGGEVGAGWVEMRVVRRRGVEVFDVHSRLPRQQI